MTACVTGATGFVGAHVARMLAERGESVRVTYRDRGRLDRLPGVEVDAVRADILDRAALTRAFRECELVFHTAGYVGSRPRERVWQVNALGPRLVVEAAAAAGVRRVVVTSSVAGIGPAAGHDVADERDVYRAGSLGLAYVEAKHEGEAEAVAAGAREGVEVVVVNPSYVLGVPVDRSRPGETSTRTVANYLRGRLPGVIDAATNVVDVEDVAAGHLLAADKGDPGERYVLGGHNIRWFDLIERIAAISGVRRPLLVFPGWVANVARARESLGLPGPIAAEAYALMSQNWRYSSAKARRRLGYRPRSLDRTLRTSVEWCRELIEEGAFDGDRPSTLSVASSALGVAGRFGVVRGLRATERYVGRRLVAGA